jgi:uncharacterized protein (TIGR00255 family)
MTGFGESRHADDRMSVAVELRSVNNRHFKLSAKISDSHSSLEPDFERQIREVAHRGTVQLSMRIERPRRAEDYRLNLIALASYRDQVAMADVGAASQVGLASLLALPGVVETRKEAADDPREDLTLLTKILGEALNKFQATRVEEGRVMGEELRAQGRLVTDALDQVAARCPEVVSHYQTRLLERVQLLVKEQGILIEAKDLIREVAILSERADIAEEITRLRAHLTQFVEVLDEPESGGRKLEFIVQEMGRETNTIGSKANDVDISRRVFEMKGALEKVRELIQNVE